MKLSRRTFLEMLGGGALGLGAAGLTAERFAAALNDLERWSVGEEAGLWSKKMAPLAK